MLKLSEKPLFSAIDFLNSFVANKSLNCKKMDADGVF